MFRVFTIILVIIRILCNILFLVESFWREEDELASPLRAKMTRPKTKYNTVFVQWLFYYILSYCCCNQELSTEHKNVGYFSLNFNVRRYFSFMNVVLTWRHKTCLFDVILNSVHISLPTCNTVEYCTLCSVQNKWNNTKEYNKSSASFQNAVSAAYSCSTYGILDRSQRYGHY